VRNVPTAYTDVLAHFRIDGRLVGVLPLGRGHINATYECRWERDGSIARYVLQRINRAVFPKPEAVMENIERVTTHLRRKAAAGCGAAGHRTLRLVPTRQGTSHYVDGDGECWRVYHFVAGARAHELADDPHQVYEAARAYGRFVCALTDLPGPALHETIPGFDDFYARIVRFREVLAADPLGRAADATDEIDFALARATTATGLSALRRQGAVPERVVHLDTKLNNVLLDDDTGEAVCVIDLDTVMPGTLLYDFGDLVRSCAAAAAEDERDLRRVGLALDRFEQLAAGYLHETRAILTPVELAQLVPAARQVTAIQGIRFLTDYLTGDVYYRTERPRHNLERCRNQFALVEDLERKTSTMEETIVRLS